MGMIEKKGLRERGPFSFANGAGARSGARSRGETPLGRCPAGWSAAAWGQVIRPHGVRRGAMFPRPGDRARYGGAPIHQGLTADGFGGGAPARTGLSSCHATPLRRPDPPRPTLAGPPPRGAGRHPLEHAHIPGEDDPTWEYLHRAADLFPIDGAYEIQATDRSCIGLCVKGLCIGEADGHWVVFRNGRAVPNTRDRFGRAMSVKAGAQELARREHRSIRDRERWRRRALARAAEPTPLEAAALAAEAAARAAQAEADALDDYMLNLPYGSHCPMSDTTAA